MGSIRRHKNAMTALLAEYHDKVNDFESKDEFDDYSFNKKRRGDDDVDGKGGMCQSIVRFARPQKARSASGEWKYIVNTGQHTQTLRLEKCSNPQESCSYLAHSYRSHCSQVYNYHRLLSWDKIRGLHVDIFKVPTCCSCQIDGYRQQFPPLGSSKPKDYTPSDHYSTIGEELDYEDEEDDDTLGYSHKYAQTYNKHQKHAQSSAYDPSELLLGSKKVRTKVYAPRPTVGSYLSPPSNEDYGLDYSYKRQRAATSGSHSSSASSSLYGSTSNNLLHQYSSRRPYKSLLNEDRVDLEIAPSEQHTDKEVNNFGRTSDTTRVQPKRKRIYSVPYTAPSTSGAIGSSISRSKTGSTSSSAAAATAAEIPAYFVPSSIDVSATNRPRISAATASTSAPTTTATSTPSSASPPYYTTSAVPPSYHINSIYNNKYSVGESSTTGGGTPKRINYSYHPIIDFFETNKRSVAAAAAAAALSSTPSSNEHAYHHKIPNSTPQDISVPVGTQYQSRNRIGFGAGAGEETNSWQPLVIES